MDDSQIVNDILGRINEKTRQDGVPESGLRFSSFHAFFRAVDFFKVACYE